MELVVRKNDLLRELQLFQGIVERKNTIPILANVLMEAKGDNVRFLATDLEVGLRSQCAALVEKSGSLTLWTPDLPKDGTLFFKAEKARSIGDFPRRKALYASENPRSQSVELSTACDFAMLRSS